MKLFRLKTKDISTFGYDYSPGDDIVVCAQHETHARRLVAKDQGNQVWMDKEQITCEILLIDTYGIKTRHYTSG